MASNKDDTSKDLMTFCMRLVHHSQWKTVRNFRCGSGKEIPNYVAIAESFGVNIEKLDNDIMSYTTDYYAVHRSVSLPKSYIGGIIRIYTDDVHTGYVRLVYEKDNTEVLLSDWKIEDYYHGVHGPALLTDMTTRYRTRKKYSKSNPEIDKVQLIMRGILIDEVRAIHCPYWPVEATEWITRKRSHGFPSKSVIKQVVRYGCDFVNVSHNKLSKDNEWRFSFSRAEGIIIKSMTTSQRNVYNSLWVINKSMTESNLCTYYFKTLLFWACEEKPGEFWADDILVDSFYQLLMEMITWVKAKFCVNYFIPSNNMMDHLIDTDLSFEIDTLGKILESRELITNVINGCRRENIISANTIIYNESPAWLNRAFVIYYRILKNSDSSYSTGRTAYFKKALFKEISDIYNGLFYQKKSVNCVTSHASAKQIYFLQSENNFLLAVNLCESPERVVFDNCSMWFANLIKNNFAISNSGSGASDRITDCTNFYHKLKSKERFTAEKLNSLNYCNEQKCLLYTRSVKIHDTKLVNNHWCDNISEGNKINGVLYYVREFNNSALVDLLYYKDWPGQNPTVNISWFIAKAYLANLYYTTQRDVNLALAACDDIIHVYGQSSENEMFAMTLPVVLSTQWTDIYDREIREMLGFYSLCSYVLDSNSRSVYLGVCPVDFAIYLATRIELEYRLNHNREYANEWNQHHKECSFDRKVNNGVYVLAMSINNSAKKLFSFRR